MEFLENLDLDIIDIAVTIISISTGGTFLLPAKFAKYFNIIGKSANIIAEIYQKAEESKKGVSTKKEE